MCTCVHVYNLDGTSYVCDGVSPLCVCVSVCQARCDEGDGHIADLTDKREGLPQSCLGYHLLALSGSITPRILQDGVGMILLW